MFKKTACKITQRLCEKGIISESDFDHDANPKYPENFSNGN